MRIEILATQTFNLFTGCLLGVGLMVSLANSLHAQNADDTAFKVKPEDILASCHPKGSLQAFQTVAVNFGEEREKLINDLLQILKNTNSSNFDQCAAAYYLGQMRASEAADALVAKIELRLDTHHVDMDGIPVMPIDFGMEAVVKIGNPSIAALIWKLEATDDAQIRHLCLQALYRIEGDKDIVQLRLQKALKAESDLQKQTRLRAALRLLAEIK